MCAGAGSRSCSVLKECYVILFKSRQTQRAPSVLQRMEEHSDICAAVCLRMKGHDAAEII